ncbi:MAG: hypothetical protein ABIT38_22940, partial [Gemmatimonadaceae bacterium]
PSPVATLRVRHYMDCRSFRRNHVAFVDDTLPGVLLVRMERHRTECAKCAQHDADVRRSLLLFRNNLPTIEPSAQFSARLAARLQNEHRLNAMPLPLFRGPGLQSFLAMSIGMIALGFAALAAGDAVQRGGAVRLPAVVLRPQGLPLGVNAAVPAAPPAFVASVSTGMAVWPALLLVEEAQSRYADGDGSRQSELEGSVRPASYTPGVTR